MHTYAQVVEVKAQGVGALVRVQAEGRIKVESLKQLEPYIIGTVSPLTDDPVPQASIEPVLKSADSLSGVLRVSCVLCVVGLTCDFEIVAGRLVGQS